MQIVQLKFRSFSQLIDYHLSPNSVSVFCCLKDHPTAQTISQTYGTIPSQSCFFVCF